MIELITQIQLSKFIFLAPYKAQDNLLTKELRENSCEEAQVAGNVVSHCRW